jgi:hypothetical protein
MPCGVRQVILAGIGLYQEAFLSRDILHGLDHQPVAGEAEVTIASPTAARPLAAWAWFGGSRVEATRQRCGDFVAITALTQAVSTGLPRGQQTMEALERFILFNARTVVRSEISAAPGGRLRAGPLAISEPYGRGIVERTL